MFKDQELQDHLNFSETVSGESFVVSEWNMNIPENIFMIGNYRYRPSERFTLEPSDQSIYTYINNSFDPTDEGRYYTGATDADITVDGGISDDGTPITFVSAKKKEELLYSLEDCFGKFRPRSGINKLRYFENRFSHHANRYMASRPRYYMSDRNDSFKYWTSYRTDSGSERGAASDTINGKNYISDASPFVVYKEPVPCNRIVVKMQTNVGTQNLGPFSNGSGSFEDPLFGYSNQTTPLRWSIQYLEGNSWVTAKSFDENSQRSNGTQIVPEHGHLELSYGLIIPDRYLSSFTYRKELRSEVLLPSSESDGAAYLVGSTDNNSGMFYIWFEGSYQQFVPEFGWNLFDDSKILPDFLYVTNLTSPKQVYDSISGTKKNSEFAYIKGLRIVVETMNVADSCFDLIELSPRVAANISDMTTAFSIKKPASDLGVAGLPVGQLLAGTGSIEIFDKDLAFSPANQNSIISNYLAQNTKIGIWEVIKNVNGFDYYVPIKTMYSEGFPETDVLNRSSSIELRDLFFQFEAIKAPQILIPDVSLSYAISTLLDSAGFSNYVFKRLDNEPDPIIQYFFVAPDKSLAEVLESLAVSTQTVMFFDEYNNFVVMSKGYAMPSQLDRDTDLTLYGSSDSYATGAYSNRNLDTDTPLSNIVSIAAKDNSVFNDGLIKYTSRYIQKSYGSIRQASLIDNEKTWIYKPSLLWEVSPEQYTKSQNEDISSQSAFSLAAVPLNTDLTSSLPYVKNNVIYNNVMDFGEGIQWTSRYSGYFYANGEIIKYDAVEYSIPGLLAAETATGNVWISSAREYQEYFSKIPFNGKMYPTGLVRIYSEPSYETIDGITRMVSGDIAKHGRGQFGTAITHHNAGLSEYWSDNSTSSATRGCKTRSEFLFNINDYQTSKAEAIALGLSTGLSGEANAIGLSSYRNGIIKNFLSSSFPTESEAKRLYSTQTGTVQSSALIMTGPNFVSTLSPNDYISYTYKKLSDSYRHFGTRMRIVGKMENSEIRGQTPYGSTTSYASMSSSSGGLSVMVNPETNNGYYFEIMALTETSPESVISGSSIYNVLFYKLMQDPLDKSTAVPVLLWAGLSNILVDDGSFAGQSRLAGEENPTVYDLAVEYENIGEKRRFYLYMNNNLVQVVDDESPLPVYNNMALFIRGSSKCMFENIYAIGGNYSQNTSKLIDLPATTAFNDGEVSVSESFRKYAMSGIVQSTYLSGISASDEPQYNMYFEEFGTIMREASYFNVRYDKAYPALSATIAPTINRIKGYTVSGFLASSYGAEFIIFNSTDTVLSLDETSGNYLRILGVAFTQQSANELSVDDYFSNRSNLSDPITLNGEIVTSPIREKEIYYKIKNSRMTYGKNSFSLDADYIQSEDDARNMMGWIVGKIMTPRASLGVTIFPNPMIQLGDIVSINYQDDSGNDLIVNSSSRFIVYNIAYSKGASGPEMIIYLSEVPN